MKFVQVEDVLVHPQWLEALENSDYQRTLSDSDIAILTLKMSVQMTQEVHNIPILGLNVHINHEIITGMVRIIHNSFYYY